MRAPSAPLVGWKAIADHSARNGGPGERQLRRLAYRHGGPILAPLGGGMVQADPGELDAWLHDRLVRLRDAEHAEPVYAGIYIPPTGDLRTSTAVAELMRQARVLGIAVIVDGQPLAA